MSDEATTTEVISEEQGPERPLPENPLLRGLFEQFDSVSWESSLGQDVARVPTEDWGAFATSARAAGFEVCVDVTVVDWLRARLERFEIVANLLSMEHKLRLRMTTTAPA